MNRRAEYDKADWTKTDVQIARKLGVSKQAVQAARKVRGLSPVAGHGGKRKNAGRKKLRPPRRTPTAEQCAESKAPIEAKSNPKNPMSKTLKSDEIAHVWAHQSHGSGKSPSAMSFSGPSFYSYRAEIGRIITHKKQKAFILHQSKEHNAFSCARQGGSDYSGATAEHVHIMQRAAEGNAPVFYIRKVSEWTPKGLLEEAKRRIAEAHDFAKRATKRRAEWDKEILGWIEKHNEIISFFKLRPKPIDAAQIEALSAKIEADRRLAKRAELKKQIKARREEQPKIDAWLTGGPRFNAHIFPPVFRIEDSQLVSSYGARIALTEAAFAIGQITGMKKSKTFGPCDIPAGRYTITKIEADKVTAGCHKIEWSEIERVSKIIESLA